MVQALSTSMNDLRGASYRAQVIQRMLVSNDKGLLDAMMVADGWQLTDSRLIVGGSTHVTSYVARTRDGYMFVFVGGINTVQQGQRVWNYYTGPYLPQPVSLVGVDTFFQDEAANIVANAMIPLAPPLYCYVFGYSAGGPIAARIKTIYTGAGLSPNEWYLGVMGSPKGGFPNEFTQWQWPAIYHWMNADDAVPLIPPQLSGLQRFMGGLSINQGSRLAGFQVWPGGINITLTNQIVVGELPVTNPVPETTQIGNWMLQAQAGAVNPHSIQVYVSRLAAAIPVAPPPRQHIASPQAVPTPAPTRRFDVLNAATQFDQQIARDAAIQNATPVVIPPQQQFTARRVGRTWYVYFAGVQVAMAPKKKRARALKNLGNAFLQKLQNEAVVNADDLVAQFQVYVDAASDPAGGFVPRLNTNP